MMPILLTVAFGCLFATFLILLIVGTILWCSCYCDVIDGHYPTKRAALEGRWNQFLELKARRRGL